MNFVFAPAITVTAELFLRFQTALAHPGSIVSFSNAQRDQKTGGISLSRGLEQPLQVRILSPAPMISQLVITAPDPKRLLRDFCLEAEEVVAGFNEVFGEPSQLVRRDCTIRHLYSSVKESEHAFRFLWEKRLGHSSDEFTKLGRPILGGGLRLVLPARDEVTDDSIVELKFESLLTDSRMLFVDCAFAWNQPVASGAMKPRELLDTVETFLDEHACPFIMSES